MTPICAVKTRLILLATLALSAMQGIAEPAPDAHQILRKAREAYTAQQHTLVGRLRKGDVSLPFELAISGNTLRYEFKKPTQVIQLRLLEKDSRLEEITRGGAEKISAARFDQRVRDTDISYEDLALKFLYWPSAAVTGEETRSLRKCWVIRVEPGRKDDSQYGSVTLWIDQQFGALSQAEANDPSGKLARRFKVTKGQKMDGAWMLKEMRIETLGRETTKDRSPTYLEIEAIAKPTP
jgi:hypothetical protein